MSVLELIHRKILSGELPKAYCHMTWYGPGTDQICVGCEQRIVATEIEVECDLPSGQTIRLHRTCYEIWSREWPTCA